LLYQLSYIGLSLYSIGFAIIRQTSIDNAQTPPSIPVHTLNKKFARHTLRRLDRFTISSVKINPGRQNNRRQKNSKRQKPNQHLHQRVQPMRHSVPLPEEPAIPLHSLCIGSATPSVREKSPGHAACPTSEPPKITQKLHPEKRRGRPATGQPLL
jgi:hypothetical protein